MIYETNSYKTPIYCLGGGNIDHKFIARDKLITGTSNMVSSHLSWGGVARNVAEANIKLILEAAQEKIA